MRFSIVALAASLVSAVMADQAFPTMPVATTVWNAGKPCTVSWKLTVAGDKTVLPVDLFKGDPAHQTLVTNLGSSATGSLSATLPANLAADWYSVRIGDSWSHYFMIKASTGATPTGVMPTPVSNSTSAIVPTGTANATTALPTAATTATATKATATATTTPNSASYLSAAPMAMAAAAAVAAVMAF